ncbi:MAG: DedA family protein [Calditrichaeota bacterium]|nr:MAG: DedA family protein [Calditrichota bacterium]
MEALAQYGYVGMFLSAFLAATVLPVSSEAVLILTVSQGLDVFGIVAVATLGNVLGAMLNYAIGRKGNHWVLRRVLRISEASLAKAEARFQRYGAPAMLLAWMPVIGDPLTVVAGIFRLHFGVFVVLVTIGKFFRYLLLAVGVQAW